MAQKKNQLLETELINFNVVGIMSNEQKDYKFVYHLNLSLGSFFKRIANLDCITKGKQYDYITYEYYDDFYNSSLFLLKNTPVINIKDVPNDKNEAIVDLFSIAPLLIPEMKSYDYILRINDDYDMDKLIVNLKKNLNIQYIQPIDKKNIKTINKLIF